MTDLERMEALQEAIHRLQETRKPLCSGATEVWRKLYNAEKHLNAEMKSLLQEAL